jgi:3-oxoacyl-[acyl-carrier protein] reductase
VALTSTTKRIFERLETLGKSHAAFTADLTSAKEVDELIRAVYARFGRIDIVVTNAGMVQQGIEFRSSRIEKITDEDWQRHLALNVTTAFNVIRAVLPPMQQQQFGRIVNVSSVTGPLVVNPRSAGYSSAKAAMTGLTRTTAIENASRNITRAVPPGWMERPHPAGKFCEKPRHKGWAHLAAAAACCSCSAALHQRLTLVVDGKRSLNTGAGDTGTNDWSAKTVHRGGRHRPRNGPEFEMLAPILPLPISKRKIAIALLAIKATS